MVGPDPMSTSAVMPYQSVCLTDWYGYDRAVCGSTNTGASTHWV